MTSSPSRIAVEAAGKSNGGLFKAKTPGFCAMCGHPHAVGEPVTPFEPGDSFTDYSSLRCSTSKFICGWCTAAWHVDFTQTALKTVICSDGVFPAASNAHIAYWVLNPPSGEWIWVMGDQKRQHIVWRATVNTSSELFQIRWGELNLTVRRRQVVIAEQAARRLACAASANRKGAALKSPFIRLSRDLTEPMHGTIRRDLHAMAATDAQVKADIAVLQSCTPGELWALTAVLYATPSPQRPQAYFPKQPTSGV
jgi:CRISPR type IV-associated protein Csf1